MSNPVIEALLTRRSVRSYESRPVEREKIDAILECGCYAPSAMNRQPWHFSVVTDRKLLDAIKEENRKLALASGDEKAVEAASDPAYDNFRGAPVAVIVSGDSGNPFAEGDCANATENMALAAHSLGLGSLYIASFRPAFKGGNADSFRALLRIPEGYEPYFALAIGYAAGPPAKAAPRRADTVSRV